MPVVRGRVRKSYRDSRILSLEKYCEGEVEVEIEEISSGPISFSSAFISLGIYD